MHNIAKAPLINYHNNHIDLTKAISDEGHLYLKNLNQLFGIGKIELSLALLNHLIYQKK